MGDFGSDPSGALGFGLTPKLLHGVQLHSDKEWAQYMAHLFGDDLPWYMLGETAYGSRLQPARAHGPIYM